MTDSSINELANAITIDNSDLELDTGCISLSVGLDNVSPLIMSEIDDAITHSDNAWDKNGVEIDAIFLYITLCDKMSCELIAIYHDSVNNLLESEVSIDVNLSPYEDYIKNIFSKSIERKFLL